MFLDKAMWCDSKPRVVKWVGYGLDVSRKYEVDTDPSGALYEES